MIKANNKLFNFISIFSTNIKTFIFEEEKLLIKIKVIEN